MFGMRRTVANRETARRTRTSSTLSLTSSRGRWTGLDYCATAEAIQNGHLTVSASSMRAANSGRNGDDRIVRIGTHALTEASQTMLGDRIRQHRGHVGGRHAGSGNHRASIFRRHVGAAIIRQEGLSREVLDSWLDRHHPGAEMAAREAPTEVEVRQDRPVTDTAHKNDSAAIPAPPDEAAPGGARPG